MPELEALYPGEKLSMSSFPSLQMISHTGHSSIRGTIKFKDTMFYADADMTTLQIPENRADATVFEVYQGGSLAHTYSSSDMLDHAQKIYDSHFAGGDALAPVFMPLDLETPLGFACFLGNNLNGRKVFVPANYNMTRIIRSLET